MQMLSDLPPIQVKDGDGEGSDPWGKVIVGELRPFAYIYELETGTWHWMGRFVEGAKDEIVYVYELHQETVRSKCGTYFRQPSEDVLEVYASVTPKTEQRLCAYCGFPKDEQPPTLYRGNERVVG